MVPALRVIYAGTPEFAVPPLQALLDQGQEVVAVYTQPDRPAGRGRRLKAGPVKALALEHGLEIRQPATLRDPAAQAGLAALHADLMVVAAYGLLLPAAVLAAPRLGCVNVHASLLPRWRGAAPIQRAILAGDAETGITLMQMDAGLDTGPMILRRACAIAADETGASLHAKLAALGAEALAEALPLIAGGQPPLEPQDEARATYAPKLTKAEARIDWSRPALELERQVRAFDPWPVAHCRLDGRPLRVWAAHAGPDAGGVPGEVVATGPEGIVVATGAGRLTITRLQPPGKRPMDATAFLNAHPLAGVRLG